MSLICLIVLQQYISILRGPEANNTKKDLRKADVQIYI